MITEPINIARDGEHVTTVANEAELMRWFHSQHSYSMHHAVTWEGYSITDSSGALIQV